jgi:nucleobase:cation symporter-1, NCS1 family
MFVPWIAGFVVYQLVNPGFVSWWAPLWIDLRDALGITVPSWASASILSFLTSAVIAAVVGGLSRPASPSAASTSSSLSS